MVVQPTPFCNINCSYCYLANRSSRATVDDRTLDSLFTKLFASGWVSHRLNLIWHAGEPTVLPCDFYKHAFEIMERHRPDDIEVVHGFQTNATLLDDAWCDLFRTARVQVGVSIDGPQRLNDANRLSRSGRSTFGKVIAGIRLLRARQIPFHVITVLTSESLRSAQELHDFYVAEGIERVGFNIDESEGDHVSGLTGGAATWNAYGAFMAEFWAIAAASRKIKSIREIDHMWQRVYQNPHHVFPNILTEPFMVLSMDHDGNLSTFSPELLGQKNAKYDDFIIGNVNTDDFERLPDSPALVRMNGDIQAGVSLCREKCAYFDYCGGGEPINKLAENGTFASADTNFCRMTRMAIADLVVMGPHAR